MEIVSHVRTHFFYLWLFSFSFLGFCLIYFACHLKQICVNKNKKKPKIKNNKKQQRRSNKRQVTAEVAEGGAEEHQQRHQNLQEEQVKRRPEGQATPLQPPL